MLTEKSFYFWEKQSELGHIGVKRVDQVIKDGTVIAETYWRCVLSPGDDLDIAVVKLGETADAAEIVAVAKIIWTPEVVAAYKAQLVANR